MDRNSFIVSVTNTQSVLSAFLLDVMACSKKKEKKIGKIIINYD